MGGYVIVTGRIPKELKEKIKKFGINVNRVIRRALEEEVRRREMELLEKSASEAAKILKKIDMNRIIRSIREDRDF